jgi:outer membrane murein-binding lipoprotein Lpp
MLTRRCLVVFAAAGSLLIVAGCSEQDAVHIRNVGAKSLNRAASFADDTQSKLKSAIQPLSASRATTSP